MRLQDYLTRFSAYDNKSRVKAVADWLDEQARTPDIAPSSDAERRVVANALWIAADELREQLSVWQ